VWTVAVLVMVGALLGFGALCFVRLFGIRFLVVRSVASEGD
jgi:hypothetical protein